MLLALEKFHMLTLYVRTGCPFCEKVLEVGETLNVEFELKNIKDSEVAEELQERGGKIQTPYLVDHEHDTEMYESDDIIDYLHQRFSIPA